MQYNSITIPIACLRNVTDLSDEQAGKILKGIVCHTKQEEYNAGIIQPILDTILAFVEESEHHRQHISTVRSEAGKRGGRPHKPATQHAPLTDPVASPTDMSATAPEASPPAPPRAKFTKPTLQQAQDYIDTYSAAHNVPSFPAQRFIDYQDSIGWIVGKTKKPMKDWQAAIRTWFRNNADEQNKPQQGREIINNKEFSQF